MAGTYGDLGPGGSPYGGLGGFGSPYGGLGAGSVGSALPPLARQRQWRLYLRDADLRRMAEADDIDSFNAVLRWNGVHSWVLVAHRDSTAGRLMSEGCGVVLYGRNTDADAWNVMLAGDADVIEWSDNGDDRTVTVSGRSDMAAVAALICYPTPYSGWAGQTNAYDTRTGTAWHVVRGLIDDNLERQYGYDDGRYAVGADSAVGGAVLARARFQNLAELAWQLCEMGAIGIDTVWDPSGTVTVQPIVPTDRSASVRFADTLGTLGAHRLTISRPEVTRSLVAGSGEEAARVLREVPSASVALSAAESAWFRRVEQLRDRRDTDDTAELDQAGALELLDKGNTRTALVAQVVDVEHQRWPRDYALGDVVSVIVDGSTFTDQVRQIEVHLGGDGERVVPTVGPPGAPLAVGSAVERLFLAGRSTARQLVDLQRR